MQPNAKKVNHVPCAEIIAGDNDRQEFETQALQALAESIADQGLIQPITVRPLSFCPECNTRRAILDDQTWVDCPACGASTIYMYEIVAGERRFRAVSIVLKWQRIAAFIVPMSDEDTDGVMLAENIARADLLPIEEAKAYRKRMDKHGWSKTETARRSNVSEGIVSGRLKLLELTEPIQRMVNQGDLPIAFGEAMSGLNSDRQQMVLTWLGKMNSRPNVDTFKAYCTELLIQQQQASMFDMTALLSPQVMTIVQANGGKLEEILPRRNDLPELPRKMGGLARVLDEYIVELLTADPDAALVLMDFWSKLLGANYAKMAPLESQTVKILAGKA